jgi:hypothetical protein
LYIKYRLASKIPKPDTLFRYPKWDHKLRLV